MVKIIEMDETVTLNEQFETEVGPVILMNKFKVVLTKSKAQGFAETIKVFKQACIWQK
jgi:hypothetical protein